jgi:hypothetical protein
MEDEMFAGASNHTITFSLLEETYQEFLALCRDKGWSEAEGLPLVFATGVAYLKNEREFSRWDGDDRNAEFIRLARYANERNAMYSVMKFYAYNYLQDAQKLEMQVTGLRGLLASTQAALERVRAENARLQAELAKRE